MVKKLLAPYLSAQRIFIKRYVTFCPPGEYIIYKPIFSKNVQQENIDRGEGA